MAINEILPFAIGVGANVMTPEDYADFPMLGVGFQPGMAFSIQENTVWRQSSFVAAMVAQFIADASGEDVLDDGDSATLLTNFITAIGNQTRGTQAGSDDNHSYVIPGSTALYTLQSYTLDPVKYDGFIQITAVNNISVATTGAGISLDIFVDSVLIVGDTTQSSQSQTCVVPVTKGDTPLIEIKVANLDVAATPTMSTQSSWVYTAE